ncbi:MAG TPA: iron ABC transporter permease, partial [Beijerinckiaceae bacterium]|nr:iron ABC transporter permease [Beijerinckiaceae bacterium]
PAGAGSKRRRRAWLRFSPLVLVLCAVLLVLILPPTIFLIDVSLHKTNPDGSFGVFTLQYYRELVDNRFFLTSLANTAIYAVGTAVVAIVLGTVQALIVERTNTPGRSWVYLGSVISLGIPYVLYVVAWLLILGRSGPINAFLNSTFGIDPINVYSMWGMIVIEGVGFTPLTFLLMSSVMKGIDASFEEASMMSGARPLATFWRVTLRMGLPGLLALALLAFVRAFESFEVPALVGLAGNINVLTTDIYQSSHSTGIPQYGESGAYSICLLVTVGFLLFWYNRLSKFAYQYQTITGKGYRPRVINLGRWRYFTAALLVLMFFLVTGLPLLILIFTSLQPFYEGVTADSFGRFTLDNYAELLAPGSFRDSIVNTLILGASTATFVVPFTALCAWLAARRKPGAWLLDQIAMAPLVFPSIVLSVAFLYVFVNLPLPLYGTLISVILASSTRYMPYGMRYAYPGVLQIHVDLEDASKSSGAREAGTFLRIVVPLLATALISSWLLIFLSSVQAVALPLMLVGPGTEIVAVTLFDLWQNGQATELASMGVIWVALMTVVSGTFYFVTRRYRIVT